jgi:hypothetical protein
MAKGMSLPVRTNRRGGAFLVEGTPYLEQVIRSGLTPNLSRNPFQAGGGVEVGISERIVFAPLAAAARNLARRGISRFFARLRAEDLARLSPGSEGLAFDEADGELIARIKYVDLEADEENEVRTNMRSALRGTASNLSTSTAGGGGG